MYQVQAFIVLIRPQSSDTAPVESHQVLETADLLVPSARLSSSDIFKRNSIFKDKMIFVAWNKIWNG
jgi:hypothetical protein